MLPQNGDPPPPDVVYSIHTQGRMGGQGWDHRCLICKPAYNQLLELSFKAMKKLILHHHRWCCDKARKLGICGVKPLTGHCGTSMLFVSHTNSNTSLQQRLKYSGRAHTLEARGHGLRSHGCLSSILLMCHLIIELIFLIKCLLNWAAWN